MNKIDALVAELCSDGVEHRKLGEVANIRRGRRVVKKNLSASEGYPVFQNSLTPLGYHTGFNEPAGTPFVICAGAAGEIGYSESEYWAADDCYSIECSEALDSKFAFYSLLRSQGTLKAQVRKASIPRLSKDVVARLEIPVPPIEVQCEVVRILDTFTDLTDELTAKLSEEATARKQQYAYYRGRLLSQENLEALDGKPVEMLRIQDVCNKICSGGTPSSKVAEYYDGDIPWVRTQDVDYGLIEMPSAAISKKGLDNSAAKWIPEGCVIVAMYGATAAKVAMNAIPVTTNQACCNLEVNLEKAFPKYVFHWLASSYEDLKALGEGSQNNISGAKVKNFPIPVPSLATQQKVVDILDRFDVLTTSLTDGLPVEIESRKAQYEYYRDRLLDFPRKE